MGKKKKQPEEVTWIYKPKRGKLVRWGSFGIYYFLTIFGLHNLFIEMNAYAVSTGKLAFWLKELFGFEIPVYNAYFAFTVGLLICILLAGAAAYGLMYLFFRKPKISEFMIDTETEMYKVSWPTWQELKGSTIATVVAVLLLGLYLFLVDMVLSSFFEVLIEFES